MQRIKARICVVGSAVPLAVDEEGRRSPNLAGGNSALHVPASALQHRFAPAVAIEDLEVQAQLVGVSAQVIILERLLTVKEQIVHLPELSLKGGCLCCSRRSECMRGRLSLYMGKASPGAQRPARSRSSPELAGAVVGGEGDPQGLDAPELPICSQSDFLKKLDS